MSRKILLIVLLCGLVAVSVVWEYRARAAMSECSPRSPCLPDVKPPVCEIPECEVVRPLVRRCEMREVSECL